MYFSTAFEPILTISALDSVKSYDRLAVYAFHGRGKSSHLFRGTVPFWWRDGPFFERADCRYGDQGRPYRVYRVRRRKVTASGYFKPTYRSVLVEGRAYIMLFLAAKAVTTGLTTPVTVRHDIVTTIRARNRRVGHTGITPRAVRATATCCFEWSFSRPALVNTPSVHSHGRLGA